MDRRLLDYLGRFVTDSRKRLIEEVLRQRTRAITVVLEDIYQPQNASAVIRTCDCFGIQDLHVIEQLHKFRVNPKVVHGASKWVDIHHFSGSPSNTEECIRILRAKGYRILATTPDPGAAPLYDVPLDQPAAVLFGTEKTGLTREAFSLADERVTVPMYGFTESLNLSVSASLVLSILRNKLQESGLHWHLSEAEKNEIRLKWYRHSVSHPDILVREFMKSLKD